MSANSGPSARALSPSARIGPRHPQTKHRVEPGGAPAGIDLTMMSRPTRLFRRRVAVVAGALLWAIVVAWTSLWSSAASSQRPAGSAAAVTATLVDALQT